jgi:hypothetical protein
MASPFSVFFRRPPRVFFAGVLTDVATAASATVFDFRGARDFLTLGSFPAAVSLVTVALISSVM